MKAAGRSWTSPVIERRVRSGRYEWQCPHCARWYWKAATHIHRYHISLCHCVALCARPNKRKVKHRGLG